MTHLIARFIHMSHAEQPMVQRLKVLWVGNDTIRIYVSSSQVIQPERRDVQMISLDHDQALALQNDIMKTLIEQGTFNMSETKTSVDD